MKQFVRHAKSIGLLSFTLGLVLISGGAPFGSTTGFAQDTIPFFQPGKIRVLIFSGRNNHDWRTTTPFLRKLLVDSGRFDVRVEEEPAGITAATLAAYDVLVLDYEGPRWGEVRKRRSRFRQAGQRAGGGPCRQLRLQRTGSVGRQSQALRPEAAPLARVFADDWRVVDAGTAQDRPRSTPLLHGEIRRPRASHNPRPGGDFCVSDELYHSPQMSPGVHILATAYDDPANGGTGKDEPLIWTVNYGQGRVLYTALATMYPPSRKAAL